LIRRAGFLLQAGGAVLSLALTSLAFALAGVLLAVWLWVQSEGSLEHGLRLASALLPGGHSLQTEGVSGSIRSGGRVGHLLWKQGTRTVELQALELRWDWRALLDGELRVDTLHVQRLHVQDLGPASQTPLTELTLPLPVKVQFAVDQVDWMGPPALQLHRLQGDYSYDGKTHFLRNVGVQMAAGSYQAEGQLQARSPMAVLLAVKGTVLTPVKIQQAPLTLLADASAEGTLLGKDARVDLAVALQPQGDGKSRPLGAMQATLQAQIRPAEPQPIANAQARWTALDLATLWPQAPHTSLSGQAQVVPEGAGWKADVMVQNAAPGSWDQQRLPLRTAHANVLYRDGQWLLSALQAAVAGGTLQAQGSLAGSPAQWSVRGALQGIEPSQLDSRWRLPALHGEVLVQQAAQDMVFEAQLTTPLKGTASGQGAQLQAKGRWATPLLQLDSLEIQTPHAKLYAQLQLDTHSYASTAHVRASMPGAQLDLDGSVAPAQGQGSSSLQVRDAQALAQWLGTLPVLGEHLGGLQVQGGVDLSARWSGGWQQGGEDMQVQASLHSQRLDLQEHFPLRDLQLDLAGTWRALALQLRTKSQVGATQLALQGQSQLALVGDGQWHARLQALQLQASHALYSKPWTMELAQPVELELRRSALAQSFSLTPGALRLSGPATGTALIQWQPVQWAHQGPADHASAARWTTRGQLQGLPLAWLELLGQTQLANMGLRGDLLFGGQWDVSGGEALRVRAGLQRSSGDLQILATDQAGAVLQAGLRDAHVNLEIDNNALRAQLVWASDAGGNAQADFFTQLQTLHGSTSWAPDAPLQATVQASLPRVGAWSLVAPVGWRIRGTLEAQATLGGTRAKPAWKGSLEARDMSVRSVVDGIDFSQGAMRLQVDGQHMDIAELTLQGAGGAAGGQLQITGTADWLADTAGGPLAPRLRMALQARAQTFRVSARPDQRLVVSGNLNAQLNNARLQVRGALVADQALFVLPEDTAPKLGSDVVVLRKAGPGRTRPEGAVPAPRFTQTVVPDISITLDPGGNFQLQGHGLKSRLTGLVTLKTEGLNATPRLTGELRTASGTYRAYGQYLNIERGTLRFGGAYDNPTLDILALRPNLQQEVGVQISGTAQLPVVRLYSDPDLPDADKLSWLVLGHAPTAGGAETAMLQQAALALLSGNGKGGTESLINAFGLDEVSLGQAATTKLDGSAGSETTVKLGKRISRDFYVAYERSLAGTLGTLYVFYDLSRRFTLRGESGTQNAVDLIFTTRFD
jgi:translocation and assembly module TamB